MAGYAAFYVTVDVGFASIRRRGQEYNIAGTYHVETADACNGSGRECLDIGHAARNLLTGTGCHRVMQLFVCRKQRLFFYEFAKRQCIVKACRTRPRQAVFLCRRQKRRGHKVSHHGCRIPITVCKALTDATPQTAKAQRHMHIECTRLCKVWDEHRLALALDCRIWERV